MDLPLDRAMTMAAEQHRIVLIDFYTTWCGPCKQLDNTTWKDEMVVALLKQNAISLKIDAEKEVVLSKKYSIDAYPTILLLRPDGSVLDRIVGYQKPLVFMASFQSALHGITALGRARSEVSEASKDDLKSLVNARRKLAQVLAQQDQYEEALREYLWLYDDGMKRVQSYVGVRSSFLLLEWQQLARKYPPALAALRQHRDTAKTLFLASPEDRSNALDFTSLNHTLKDDQTSVDVFDQLPLNSPGRKVLGPAIWYELIVQRRYADALKARTPAGHPRSNC